MKINILAPSSYHCWLYLVELLEWPHSICPTPLQELADEALDHKL